MTVDGAIPIKISKAVYAPSFGFDILSVGVMETLGITTVLGPNARLEKGKTSILSRHRGLFYIDAVTTTYSGGASAALTATRRRPQMPELEAIAAKTHDASATPRDSTISKSETRLRCLTLTNHVKNPDATPWISTVQFFEIFAGAGSMSSAAKAHGGEIAMLTEKEPAARENLRHRFPDTMIHDDIGDDS